MNDTFPRRLAALTTLLFAALAAPAGAGDVLVKTDTGVVRGMASPEVREFRGIPFALPPVDARRFSPPVPRTPWPSILDATHFRSPCPQVVRYGQTDASDDEDCLYLNITVPQRRGTRSTPLLPVLVWVHGGAFVGGSADIYPLRYLATQGDMLVVSINCRLGVFGFMAHPAFDGAHNGALGLEDQREALRWVRRNIRAFGGDPRNVTLAGESAGAASVCMQLIAPRQSQGLFEKAIVQSAGCAIKLRTQAEAGAVGLEVAARVHCGEPPAALGCLRSKSVAELLKAQTDVSDARPLAFAPSIGSLSTPQQGLAALSAGEFLRVPILNGGNRDEMRLYVGYEVAGGGVVTSESLGERLRGLYTDNAAKVAAVYQLPPGASAPAWLGRIESDFLPGAALSNCLILETTRLASRHVPVYGYEFTDANAPPVMPNPGFEMGAVHSAELPYFFPGISYNRRIDGPDVPKTSQRLSEQMVAYWSAFIHSGHPSAHGLTEWPRYRSDGDVMRLDPRDSAPFDSWAAHRCAFWQSLYPGALP